MKKTNKPFKAYKVFDSDWKCRDYSFLKKGTVIGTRHRITDPLELCKSGFHFCRKLSNCFDYYAFDLKNKVAEILVHGNVVGSPDDKECTDDFEILRELTWEEVLRECNSGDWNSGNRNSGNRNSGNENSGHWNYGDKNSGDRNSGNENSGNWNSGNENSGNWNSGYRNSGDWNYGHKNSGDRNSGNENSGNWNSGDGNIGYFNTNEPDKIRIFNKWIDKQEIIFPNFFYFDIVKWVYKSQATTKEKKIYKKEIETTGKFLKVLEYKEAFKNSWKNATKDDKNKVFDLPGFDAEIFYEISGIDLRKKKKR